MSRITIRSKKQALRVVPVGVHPWDDAAFEITFSRDRSFLDATTHTRGRPPDYLTGGADTGVNFIRPAGQRLSTIYSEPSRGSGAHTPENGATISLNSASLPEEPEEHQQDCEDESV